MQKHERMALAEAERLVKPLGLTASFDPGKRHPSIRIAGAGRSHRLTVCGSPRTGEVEAVNHIRQQVRRWLRQEGLTT